MDQAARREPTIVTAYLVKVFGTDDLPKVIITPHEPELIPIGASHLLIRLGGDSESAGHVMSVTDEGLRIDDDLGPEYSIITAAPCITIEKRRFVEVIGANSVEQDQPIGFQLPPKTPR